MRSPTVRETDHHQSKEDGDEKERRKGKHTDQTEQTQNATKHLHDKNLHKQRRIRGISQSCRRARDAHGDTAEQVTDAHSQSTPEERVT